MSEATPTSSAASIQLADTLSTLDFTHVPNGAALARQAAAGASADSMPLTARRAGDSSGSSMLTSSAASGLGRQHSSTDFVYGTVLRDSTGSGTEIVFYDGARPHTLGARHEPLHISKSDGVLIRPVARKLIAAVPRAHGEWFGIRGTPAYAYVVVRRRAGDAVREAVIYRAHSLPRVVEEQGHGVPGTRLPGAASAARARSLGDLHVYATAPRVGQERAVVAFPSVDTLRAPEPPPMAYVQCDVCTAARDGVKGAPNTVALPCGAVHVDTAEEHRRHCGDGNSTFAVHPLPSRWALATDAA